MGHYNLFWCRTRRWSNGQRRNNMKSGREAFIILLINDRCYWPMPLSTDAHPTSGHYRVSNLWLDWIRIGVPKAYPPPPHFWDDDSMDGLVTIHCLLIKIALDFVEIDEDMHEPSWHDMVLPPWRAGMMYTVLWHDMYGHCARIRLYECAWIMYTMWYVHIVEVMYTVHDAMWSLRWGDMINDHPCVFYVICSFYLANLNAKTGI